MRWDIEDTRLVKGYAYLVYREGLTKYRAVSDLHFYLRSNKSWSSIYNKLCRELKTCG